MRRLWLAALLAGLAQGQTYHIVTVTPDATAAAQGQVRLTEKSNALARHYLALEGPDTLGANVRYQFDGTTTTGCLNGSLSGGVYTITTSTAGCALGVAGGYVITGNSTGPLPVSGDVYGIYSGTIPGTGFGWSLLHDSGAGAVYLVGAQAPSGLNNSFTAYKSNGQMVVTAASIIDVQTPLWTASGNVEPEMDNISNFGSLSKRWKKLFGIDAQLDGVSRFGSVFLNDAQPASGFANGLYASYSAGANWLIAHDGGAGASLQVGAQASAGTINAYSLYDQAGTVLMAGSASITILTPSFTLGATTTTLLGITGSTQCLQVNSSGVLSGTGAGCGSGVASVTGSGSGISVSPTTGAVVVSNTGVTGITVTSPLTTTGATGSVLLTCSGCLTSGSSPTISGDWTFGGTTRFTGGTSPGAGAAAGLYAGYGAGAGWAYLKDGGAGAVFDMATVNTSGAVTSRVFLLGATGIWLQSAGGVATIGGTPFSVSGALTLLSTVTSDVMPTSNNAYKLGASGARWSKLWTVDVDVSGTCTGCGVTTQTNATASRALGTVYQNTSGMPMWVTVTVLSTGTSVPGGSVAYTDSSATPTTVVAQNTLSLGGGGSYSTSLSISFVVLPNNYYKVVGSNSPTLTQWFEWN